MDDYDCCRECVTHRQGLFRRWCWDIDQKVCPKCRRELERIDGIHWLCYACDTMFIAVLCERLPDEYRPENLKQDDVINHD